MVAEGTASLHIPEAFVYLCDMSTFPDNSASEFPYLKHFFFKYSLFQP